MGHRRNEGEVSLLIDFFMKKKVRVFIYGIILGLICQIFIKPFSYSSYVVSLGTPVLNLLLLFQPELPVFPLTFVTAVTASLLRGIISAAGSGTFSEMFFPALYYYGLYCLFLSYCCYMLDHPKRFRLIAGMIFCDFSANALQLMLMGHIEGKAVMDAALVSVIRGLLVWGIYWMYEWEMLYIRKSEHQRHYAQLNSIVADVYAESFYLRKSMTDLNTLTRKSHQLYEDLESRGLNGQPALDIAREAHEIRKDYQRIFQGITSLVNAHEEKSLPLSYILQIIRDNTLHQISERGQHINLRVKCKKDLLIQYYYDIFTILNNLLINSMDACGEYGHITVSASVEPDMLRLRVSDDGCGMDEDTQKYIFGAGFSTKYDTATGQMSTGIGLCHVENIVKHLDGNISVKSAPDGGSEFTVLLPVEKIGVIK